MKFNTVKLGEYLYIKGRIGWKGLKKKEYLDKSDFRIINGESLTENGIDWSKAGYISKERYDESPEIMLQPDDILISKDGTIGKIGYIDSLNTPTTVASGIFVIRNQKPKIINTRFIYHFFCSKYFKNFITMRTEGSVIPHLYQKDFVDLDFPLPELNVQDKIVGILDAICNKIDLNKSINENLERQLRSIFTELFAEKIANVETNNHLSLGELVISIDNRGKTPPLETVPTEYPIIDVRALSGDSRIVNYANCTKYVSYETYSSWFRSGHPKPKNILISTVGSLAEIKIFLGSKGCIAQNVVGFRTRNISPYYLYQYLSAIKKDLVAYNIGSVQPSIKVTHIIKHPIYVPTKEELDTFDALAENATNTIYNNVLESECLANLRDTLLPKLMSGEIDLSEVQF